MKVHDISIHLGTACNFDCSYCDRGFVRSIGDQNFKSGHLADLEKFFVFLQQHEGPAFPGDFLSFHGGEPLIYTSMMTRMINILDKVFGDEKPVQIFIQTNGSLLLDSVAFLEQWKHRLFVSISYDFLFQDQNRTAIDLQASLELLTSLGIPVQLQYVMPINEPRAFSLDTVKAIVSACNKYGLRQINLIPLRHLRGGDKFKVLLDEVSMVSLFAALTRFVEILYTLGVAVVVDGQYKGIDKNYFADHKQLVLSPDGFIYPEYDFLEYKMEDARIGSWVEPSLSRVTDYDNRLLPGCRSCSSAPSCGLKYWYKEFGQVPGGNCKLFYLLMDTVIRHTQKMRTKPTMFDWVGT